MTLAIRFHGHACFSLERAGQRLLIDPYEHGALNGAVRIPALLDVFDGVLCTHEHVDHSARHAVPSAIDLGTASDFAGIQIEAHPVFHDEFGGRLRGGTSSVLRLTSDEGVVVHCGDIGERPVGETLAWLRAVPIDVLIVPVGGYFTLGPDGAAELTALVQPRVVVPCHSADDGVELPQLSPRTTFTSRFAAERTHEADTVSLPLVDNSATVVVLRPTHLSQRHGRGKHPPR